MNLDKDTLHGLSKFLSKFVVLTAPGLVINEFVFHKGIYGGGISNIYDLLLLLIWSAIFSLPYYICIILNIAWHEIKSKEVLVNAENDPEIFESGIPLLFILIVINYVIFKVMLAMNWMSSSIKIGVLQPYALLVISVVTSCAISFPMGKIYYSLLNKFMAKISNALQQRINK